MANYTQTEPYQLFEPLRTEYHHPELKTEPLEYEAARQTYTYAAHQPYSEEELAESLGWMEYNQSTQGNLIQRHGMQLSSEMSNQQGMTHHRSASIPHSGSLASNGTFGSVPLRQSAHSPSGWHSSLDSPSIQDAASHRELGAPSIPEHEHNRKDGLVVAAEKKAMRRYSHNAVERRRRDNINEQIHELALLVNELNNIYSPRPESVVTNSSTNTKPNKGMVLRKSVEYIRMLRSMVEEKTERERLLEQEINRLGGTIPSSHAQDSAVSMWIDESAIAEDED